MINLEQNYLVFFGLDEVRGLDGVCGEFVVEGLGSLGLRPASTTSLTTRLTSFLGRFPCLGGYLTVLCFVCFAILITSLNMLRCITCLRRQPFRNNESVIIKDKIFNLQLKPLCNLR